MGILNLPDPWQREYTEVWRREKWYLRRYETQPASLAQRGLSSVASEKMAEPLHKAFEKAFQLVFEKGGGMIAWAERRDKRQMDYAAHAAAAQEQEDRRNLQAFRKAAKKAGRGSSLAAGAAGAGMGLMGVALPDIPLLTGMLLKCIYETADSFGFPCEGEAERIYVLRILETALSWGEDLEEKSRALDRFAQSGAWEPGAELEGQIHLTARKLSEAALYDKVLQNIPVAGAVGGLSDARLIRRVQSYAQIKYHKRFLISRKRNRT